MCGSVGSQSHLLLLKHPLLVEDLHRVELPGHPRLHQIHLQAERRLLRRPTPRRLCCPGTAEAPVSARTVSVAASRSRRAAGGGGTVTATRVNAADA